MSHSEPDENPEEANAPLAWRLMNTADDNSDKMPEQVYLNLANLSADVAKLERKEERLRKYVVENVGEGCEALIPSDEEVDDNDFYAQSDDEDDDDDDDYVHNAFSCTSSNPCGGVHVHSSCYGSVSLRGTMAVRRDYEDVQNPAKDITFKSAAPSGLYIKHHNTFYCIPESAVMRSINKCIEIPDFEMFDELTSPGHRAFNWDLHRDLLDPASIVVLRMRRRFGKNESAIGSTGKYDFYWGVFLTLKNGSGKTHDHRIVHLLPETTIYNLYNDLKGDDQTKSSSLCTKWAPSFINSTEFSPCLRVRENPIPGRNKRSIVSNSGQLRGNYWSEVPDSKRVRMTSEFAQGV